MPASKTYEEFVNKFKSKKTTDDCYTPDVIYKVVKDWAIKEMDWGGTYGSSSILAGRRL